MMYKCPTGIGQTLIPGNYVAATQVLPQLLSLEEKKKKDFQKKIGKN